MTEQKIAAMLVMPDGSQPKADRTGLFETKASIRLPFLRDSKLQITFEPDYTSASDVVTAVFSLTRLPEAFQAELAPHLFAAYEESIDIMSDEYATPQEHLDEEAKWSKTFKNPTTPKSASDIWKLVEFFGIHVEKNSVNGKLYAKIRGEVAWDAEHGTSLFFENGTAFQRLGDLNS